MEKQEIHEKGPVVLLEVEINESRRRYLTIEVSPLVAEKICAWTMKYNPTEIELNRAIRAVKGAKVVKEEVMHDSYEIGCVDVLRHPDADL